MLKQKQIGNFTFPTIADMNASTDFLDGEIALCLENNTFYKKVSGTAQHVVGQNEGSLVHDYSNLSPITLDASYGNIDDIAFEKETGSVLFKEFNGNWKKLFFNAEISNYQTSVFIPDSSTTLDIDLSVANNNLFVFDTTNTTASKSISIVNPINWSTGSKFLVGIEHYASLAVTLTFSFDTKYLTRDGKPLSQFLTQNQSTNTFKYFMFEIGNDGNCYLMYSSTDEVLPNNTIVDNSSSKYLDIGNTRIQWGTISNFGDYGDITFPVPFLDTSYSFVATSGGGGALVSGGLPSTTGLTSIRFTASSTDISVSSAPLSWQCIGLKP